MSLDTPDEVVEPLEVEELSLREIIEDAVEEHDPDHELVPASAGTEEPQPSPVPVAAESDTAPLPAVSQPPSATPAQEPPAAPSTELKAPAQWKPAVREKWNSLPREVQEEVLRRESDGMRLIGSVGPKIRLADEVAAHLAPFQEQLASAGVAPEALLNDMFTSVKMLSSGSPQERAEVVANIVQSYGVDLRTLDAILTRRIQMPPEVFEAQQLAARANAVLQQQSSQQNHESALAAERALAAFAADPKHEFIADVRDLMADLIESGRAKTLEDAYSAAVWANQDTRKILLQREAQSRAATKTNRAIAARKASSSVSGAPAAAGAAQAAPGNMSLRESIEAAFEEHSSL